MTVNETLTQRANTHGSFKDNADIAQRLKAVIRSGKEYAVLSNDKREAIDMICHKLARIVSGNPEYADHWHDVAGYATLVDNDLLDRLI
mgnify:CR=1 FL=1